MNLESIVKAMLMRQSEVGSAPSSCLDHTWGVDECNGAVHITHDGKRDQLTEQSLKAPPISLYVADCDYDGEGVFDQSSVCSEDFDLASALDGTSPKWKLMEITIQSSGLIILSFVNARLDDCTIDDGKLVNPDWESVTINADTEHLVLLLETEGGKRQFVIVQYYVDAFGGTITSITEIEDGVKASRLSTSGEMDDSGMPLWMGAVYGSAGELPPDTSPSHHTDQPGT